jgi:ABC-type Zn2+ transport system substrate-binding protein/surface adhesin
MKRLLSLALAVLLASAASAAAAEAPKVVVGIKPVHSLVAALMKGVAEPALIVEGATTPYGYTLDAGDRRALEDADLVVWVGPELEPYLQRPLADAGTGTRVMELLADENFKVLPRRDDMERRDPFIWLDVRNVEVMVDELFATLVAVDPAHEAAYLENRRTLKVAMARLDREFEYGFRAVAAGEGFAYHDTQQYFEQAYAFKVRGFVAPEPGARADAARLLQVHAQLAAREKSCFFVEAGLPQDRLSLITQGTGARVAELDSFATGFAAGPDLYGKMMRHNFDVIAGCFKAVGAHYEPPHAAPDGPGKAE